MKYCDRCRPAALRSSRFAKHAVGRRQSVSSDSAVPEDQVNDQDQQENAADAEPASVPVSAISEAAAEQEQQNKNDQNEVHRLSFCAGMKRGKAYTGAT